MKIMHALLLGLFTTWAGVCGSVQAQVASVAPPSTDAADANAPTQPYWRVMGSPTTYHYHYSPEHRHVYMLGLERQYPGGLVMGGTWFRNSFGQPSAYVYAGRRFIDPDYPKYFVQVTGGVLYGYKPPYQNKVPLNHDGFSPGAVLSTGWQITPRWSTQLDFLGNSAVMLQFSADFP